jgi:hypothetical protein
MVLTWGKRETLNFLFVDLGSNLLGSLKPNKTVILNTKMHKIFPVKNYFFFDPAPPSLVECKSQMSLKLFQIISTSKERMDFSSIFGKNDDLSLVKSCFLHALHSMAAVQFN